MGGDERLAVGAGVDGAGIGADDRRERSDFLAYELGPTLVAVFLALLSLPFVALSLDATDYGVATDYGIFAQVPATDLGRWAGAFGAVMAAALVAGTIGAPLVRSHAVLGALFTILVAWVIGIAAVPVLPVLLHQNHGGYLGYAKFCLDSCSPEIHTNDPVSGLGELKFFWLGPLVEPVPFALLAAGVACWTRMVRRWIPKQQPTLR
jgi:hypothetical protein